MPRRRFRLASRAIVCVRAMVSQTAFGVNVICSNDAGEVVLVRPRLQDGWSLPGGGVAAGEPPALAAARELTEETGHRGGSEPELFGLYTRRLLWATNVIAVYCVAGGEIAFRPNWEIRDAGWFAPEALPRGASVGARRRLAEWAGEMPKAHYW